MWTRVVSLIVIASSYVRQQKVYGFDTGFVVHARGWGELRTEDCGLLWENIVWEHLLAQSGEPVVR